MLDIMKERSVLEKYKIIAKNETGAVFFNLDNKSKFLIKQHHLDGVLNEKDKNRLLNVSGERLLTPLELIKESFCVYAVYKCDPYKTLADYVKKKGKLAEDTVIEIMKQILNGYDELIRNDITHKNIEPQNILVIKEKEVKVLMFGFGIKEIRSLETKNYLAPEVLIDNNPSTSKSDIWSIGAILYFMCNAAPPSEGSKHLNRKDIGYYCVDFMERCFEYEPWRRPTIKGLKLHPFLNKKEEKVSMDRKYTCNCGFRNEVILSCGHSFCAECIAHKRRTSHFDNKVAFDTLIHCSYCTISFEIGKN